MADSQKLLPIPRATRPGARLLRALLAVTAAVVGLLAIGVVVGPLLLRGPLLARLILSVFPAVAGHVELGSASVEPLAVVDLFLGRPFRLKLERLGVTDPVGRPVFFAGEIAARVKLHREPLVVDVQELRIGPGTWKMLYDRRRGVSLAAAFVPVKTSAQTPAEAGRHAPPRAVSLSLDHVELDDLDVVLDFPDWGLELAHASAVGSLSAAAEPGKPGTFTFDVHDVRASSGSRLRVGGAGRSWSAELPFDAVAIARAAAPPEHPGDLRLDVAGAVTGRAVLAGTSTFHGVFASAGRAGPGMDMDARWTNFADASARLRAAWRPIVARVMGTDAIDLAGSAHGPFSGLSAHVEARAEKLVLAMGVTPDLRADADLTLRGFDTAMRVPPSLRGLLGGVATGHARVDAQLAKSITNMSGTVTALDLRLDRTHPGLFPPRWRIRKSAAPPASAPALEQGQPVLDMTVASARMDRGVIDVHGFGVTVGGGRLSGNASLTTVDRRSGKSLAEPLMRAAIDFDRLDLGMLGPPLRGTRLSGNVRAAGSSDDLRLALAFLGRRQVVVIGVPVTLPERASARLRGGDTVTVPPFTLLGPDGGRLEARGSAVLERSVDVALALRSWPIAATGLPALVPGGHDARWGGLVDGEVSVRGPFADPGLSGHLDFRSVVAAGLALGDGGLAFARERQRIRFDGHLGPYIQASGQLRLGDRRSLQATAKLAAFPLDAWLGRALPRATGSVTGDVDVALANGKPPEGEARLTDVRLGWGRALALANRNVLRVRGTPDGFTLDPCLLEGSGVALSIQGRLAGDTLEATAEGRAALATLVGLLPRAPVTIVYPAGDVVFGAHVTGPTSAPVVDLGASVREPLTLSVIAGGRPALAITVPDGKATWHGAGAGQPRLAVDGLVLSTPGARVVVAGQAMVDVGDPGASAGTWRASASVDAAALAPLVSPQLERAEGRLSLAAELDGDPRHGRWRGSVDAPGVVLVPRGADTRVSIAPLHATVDDAGLVRVGQTVVSLGPSGRVTVGTPSEPSVVEIRKLDPFDVGRVGMVLRASNLATPPQRLAGLRTSDGVLDLRLDGPDGAGRYLLSGTVSAAHADYLPPSEQSTTSTVSTRGSSPLARFLRRLWLDVRLRFPQMAVEAPGPNLTLDVDCRLQGPLSKLQTSGKLQGRSLYSKMALFLADKVGGKSVRECRK